MTIEAIVTDPCSHVGARVNKDGELVVGELSASTFVAVEMNVNDQVYSLVTPISGRRVRITGVVITTSRTIGNEGVSINLYSASSAISGVSLGNIFTVDLVKQDKIVMTGLNLEVPEGTWINATASDSTVNLSLIFYFI